jgi:predicted nucleotidyltransferase
MPRPPRTDQGFLRAPLTAVFRSPGAVRVLRALSRHGGLLAVPTLERAAGLTNAGTHRVVRPLVEVGVVRPEGQGRVTAYRLDVAHPLAPALTALFAAEAARVDRVLDAIRLAAAPHQPTAVWLFGSAARGDDTPASDVDVAVVFPAGSPGTALEAIREALAPTEDTERVIVSVIGLWPADVARLVAGERGEPDPLWRAFERDAIPLLGEPPALLRPRGATDAPARAPRAAPRSRPRRAPRLREPT